MSSTACESLRVSGTVPESIVDGPGLRYTLFVQGCPRRCSGCHNPGTHDFNGGEGMALRDILLAFDENPLLSGMTFSGGEPFCQAAPLISLAEAVHARGKDIIIYTGYTLAELLCLGKEEPAILSLLAACDLLIDGPYMEAQRDLTLSFRGSANQRLISREEIHKHLPEWAKHAP